MEKSYWSRLGTQRRVSRRSVMRGAGVAAAGITGAALIGCGGSDEEVVASGGSAATAAATQALAQVTETQAAAATSTQTSVAAVATTAASIDPYPGVKRGGKLVGSWIQDPPTIDPYGNLSYLAKYPSSFSVSRLFMNGTGEGQSPYNLGPVPDLAESAETTDAVTWIVKLKQGVKFHNKAPVYEREVTSADVVSSWNKLIADESPNKDTVPNIDSCEAIDDYTLKFVCGAPSATFIDTMGDPNALWVQPVEGHNGGFDPAQEIIGSGPFIFESYEPSVDFKFSRNPNWHGSLSPMGSKFSAPFVDEFHWISVPEYQNRLAQLKAGNLHYLNSINANDVIPTKAEMPGLQWFGARPALMSFLYFSNNELDANPVWSDVRFRRATSMAQNRDDITELGYEVEAMVKAGVGSKEDLLRWNNLIPAGFEKWWLNPTDPKMGKAGNDFKYNPAEAAKLLQATGYDGSEIKFQYYPYGGTGGTFNKIGEAVQAYLTAVGLKTEIEHQDYASQYITQTFTGNFSGIAWGYETPFPEVGGYFPRMFGDNARNHGRIKDARISELDALQAAESDYEQRREYIHEIQKINAENMYYVPGQAGAGVNWTGTVESSGGYRVWKSYGQGAENTAWMWLKS
jgi:peptide/nickel transport system substrate-binding protein